jgi:hypothetical protein
LQLNDNINKINQKYLDITKTKPKIDEQKKLKEIKTKITVLKSCIIIIHERFSGYIEQLKVPLNRKNPSDIRILGDLSDLNKKLRNYSSYVDLQQTFEKYKEFKTSIISLLDYLIKFYEIKTKDATIYRQHNLEINESIKILNEAKDAVDSNLSFEDAVDSNLSFEDEYTMSVGGSRKYKNKSKKQSKKQSKKNNYRLKRKTHKTKNSKTKKIIHKH